MHDGDLVISAWVGLSSVFVCCSRQMCACMRESVFYLLLTCPCMWTLLQCSERECVCGVKTSAQRALIVGLLRFKSFPVFFLESLWEFQDKVESLTLLTSFPLV